MGLLRFRSNGSPFGVDDGNIRGHNVFEFLFKVWGLAWPYRRRPLMGVLARLIAGLLEPVMIAMVVVVYGLIVPSANTAFHVTPLAVRFQRTPDFMQDWAVSTPQTLISGSRLFYET
jgi:hypothetical protein